MFFILNSESQGVTQEEHDCIQWTITALRYIWDEKQSSKMQDISDSESYNLKDSLLCSILIIPHHHNRSTQHGRDCQQKNETIPGGSKYRIVILYVAFYSKPSSISLRKRRNSFFSMNIQFTAFCRKSSRTILIEGDISIAHWHITLHPTSSNHKWKGWLHSTVSEFFQDSSAIYKWKIG